MEEHGMESVCKRGDISACLRLLSLHARIHGRKSCPSISACGEINLHGILHINHNGGAASTHDSQNFKRREEVDEAILDMNQRKECADDCNESGVSNIADDKGTHFSASHSHRQMERLTKTQVLLLLENLYRDHPGAVWRTASRRAMEARGNVDQNNENYANLIYGEVTFVAFKNLLDIYTPLACHHKALRAAESSFVQKSIAVRPGLTFYDLGCGAGRPVFMALLLRTEIKKACGIELLAGMHRMNVELLQLFNVEVRPWLHPSRQSQEISFIHGDFLEVDWSDADMVFINATCFGDRLFEKLEDRARSILKDGTIVISVSRCFQKEDDWEVLEQRERRMSWSSAMVFVMKKRI